MTLYVDLMSQPSRACAILRDLYLGGGMSGGGSDSNANAAAVGVRAVRLDRGEQRQEPYASLNPLQKVPFLEIAGGAEGLAESGAILPFLAASFPDRVPENWRRPQADRLRAARHDAALLWSQSALRAGATRAVFHRVIGRLVFKQETSRDVAAHGAQVLRAALADLERAWLQGGARRFIGHGEGPAGASGELPSAADLICLCELDQLLLLEAADPRGGPCMRDFVPPGSAVAAWRERVVEAVGGEAGAYGRAVRTLRAAAARFAAMRRQEELVEEEERRRQREGSGGGGGGGGKSKL